MVAGVAHSNKLNCDVYFASAASYPGSLPVQSNGLCPQMVFYQQCNYDN